VESQATQFSGCRFCCREGVAGCFFPALNLLLVSRL
jgi:hypothetical protein